MSDAPDTDQKTQAPTAKRKSDAAKKGDILQSRELGTALVMIGGAAWFALAGPWMVDALAIMLKTGLSIAPNDAHDFDPATAAAQQIRGVLWPLATLFGTTMAAAIAAPALLGSLGFRSGAFAFKPEKLNPLSGLKRIFGINGVIELGKSLTKAILLGGIGYYLLFHDLRAVLALSGGDVYPAMGYIGSHMISAILLLSAGLFVIAAIDVPIQYLRHNSRLKMTLQELKEEMRQSDGAPELKQAQRARAQEIFSGSARKAVSDATVILTNPTHFAVAIRYRPGIDAAPVVAARGRGEVALAIRTLAKAQGVPALEYPQLTRAIYFTTRAGHSISEDLYIAVATILAFVFNLDRAVADGITPPSVIVPRAKHYDEHGKRKTN